MRLSTDRAASCPSGGQAQGDFPSLALSPDAAQASERVSAAGSLQTECAARNGRRREDGSPKGQDPARSWPGLGSRQPMRRSRARHYRHCLRRASFAVDQLWPERGCASKRKPGVWPGVSMPAGKSLGAVQRGESPAIFSVRQRCRSERANVAISLGLDDHVRPLSATFRRFHVSGSNLIELGHEAYREGSGTSFRHGEGLLYQQARQEQ
ncbi:hypothetical protein BV363_05516 [Pseudomonas syringae pv. actinidiae]|nr:hypothetical protein BV363_05516 [Pseudomonas syringae pv. actinidiae]